MLQEWKDLLPEMGAHSGDSYSHLSEAQLRRMARCARARWLVETGRDSQDRVTQREIADIRRAFRDEGEDVDWLLSQREVVREHGIRNSWNPVIVGHNITLAGMVFPLEWDDTSQFRRFLLAPDLGHCSHEAPPIAYQVAYVDVLREVDVSTLGHDDAHGGPCLRVEGVIRFNAAAYHAVRSRWHVAGRCKPCDRGDERCACLDGGNRGVCSRTRGQSRCAQAHPWPLFVLDGVSGAGINRGSVRACFKQGCARALRIHAEIGQLLRSTPDAQ